MAADKLYNEKEAAERLGLKPSTLRTWRSRPTAGCIPHIKLGDGPRAAIRYSEADILKWLEQHRQK